MLKTEMVEGYCARLNSSRATNLFQLSKEEKLV